MRTKFKTSSELVSYIEDLEESFNESMQRVADGKVPLDRIPLANDNLRSKLLKKCIARYSYGEDLAILKKSFSDYLDHYIEGYWVGLWKLKISEEEILNQYSLSAYTEILWTLSLAFLLNVDDSRFRKIVNLIDTDDVIDNLLEFIIRSRLPQRETKSQESYKKHFFVPKAYATIRQVLNENDPEKSEEMLKKFVEKEWYKNHKGAGWYNSHKSDFNTFFGYWSFETAAVVRIKNLDDSSFRECQFYPKDLTNFQG